MQMKRRTVLKAAATAAVGFHIVPRHVLGGKGITPPSDQLNIASVGFGGQGGGLLRDRAFAGLNVVALCDVDWKLCANTFKAFPKAEAFRDYRVMLNKCKGIDAVIVATPDHMHAPVTLAALRVGKPDGAKAGFAYSGPFTEALLVGNLAVRLQKRIEWDSGNMKATNAPEAEPLIRKTYPAGFGI